VTDLVSVARFAAHHGQRRLQLGAAVAHAVAAAAGTAGRVCAGMLTRRSRGGRILCGLHAHAGFDTRSEHLLPYECPLAATLPVTLLWMALHARGIVSSEQGTIPGRCWKLAPAVGSCRTMEGTVVARRGLLSLQGPSLASFQSRAEPWRWQAAEVSGPFVMPHELPL